MTGSTASGAKAPLDRSRAPVRRLKWTNVLFLLAAHLLAVFAVVYLAALDFSWWTVGLGVCWLFLCGVAITGGYHRLFAHPTYKASWPLRVFYLCFGAASVQNSALAWASDHADHHADTDEEEDPYDATRGFWWSHVGWVFFESSAKRDYARVPHLAWDPLVRFQHRAYVPLAILFGVLLPASLGLLWNDPLGALLCAGFLRLVVQWHQTFFINSLAHMVGTRSYSTSCTARDSWITALFTLGEGYHNFHHRFPGDYRNGRHWYQYDPTKWFISLASKVGLAHDLRRVPRPLIERARRATRVGAAS